MNQKFQDQFAEEGEVERHPAWQGEISLAQISLLLSHERPYTYALSGKGPNKYWLSYARSRNRGVVHIHFAKICIEKRGFFRGVYRNGATITFYTPEALIRYKLKGKGVPLSRLSLQMSA